VHLTGKIGRRYYNWHANIHAQVFIVKMSNILSVCLDMLKNIYVLMQIYIKSINLYTSRPINSCGRKLCWTVIENNVQMRVSLRWLWRVLCSGMWRRVVRWKQSSAWWLLQAGFLLGLFLDPKDGGEIFLRNICWISTDYTEWYPRMTYFGILVCVCKRVVNCSTNKLGILWMV
jgi:hypothetical protein